MNTASQEIKIAIAISAKCISTDKAVKMLHSTRLFSFALLLLCIPLSESQGGIVVSTSYQVGTINPGDTTANVTVRVFGSSNLPLNQNQLVGHYAFTLTITPQGAAGPIAVTSRSYTGTADNNPDRWADLKTESLLPSYDAATRTFTFKGGTKAEDPPSAVFNAAIRPFTSSALNEIASFTFTTSTDGTYLITTAASSTFGGVTGTNLLLNGFAISEDPNLAGVSATQIPNNVFETNNIIVSGITAVPEPSSLLLLGLAGAGIAGHRVRKLRKAKLAA